MKGGPKSSLRPFLHRALQLEGSFFSPDLKIGVIRPSHHN